MHSGHGREVLSP